MTQGTNFKLVSGHRIAVVGLSANTDRPSFDVARAMQRAGFHIVPVNPRYVGTKILGEPCVGAVAEIRDAIDVVNCFRRGVEMPALTAEVVAMNPPPRVLWIQMGIQSAEARTMGEAVGIQVIENQCIKIAY
jgi:predicted CoA-binding protein